MKRVILLGRRRVLWGIVMTACLLSGFILTTRSANLLWRSTAVRVAQGSHFNPAASPNPESRIPNPGYGSAAQPRLAESYGKLPLSFEVNKGQTDSRVKFLSRGGGYSLFLTGNEAVLSLRKGSRQSKVESRTGAGIGSADLALRSAAFPGLLRSPAEELETNARTADPKTGSALRGLLGSSFQFPVSNFQTPATNNEPRTTDALLRMKLVGANPNPKIVGMDELPGKSNYFIGNDPKKWRTNVPNYAKVRYANVYPGVDLVYYGNQGELEYDFVVQPGSDLRQIALDVGAGLVPAQGGHPQGVPLRIDGHGDLVVGTDGGEVTFHKPVIYQPATYNEPRTTNKELIEGKYMLAGNRVTFEVANYDKTRPLVIDPALAYSTYLGGSDYDAGYGIAVDASGHSYITGYTASFDFPVIPGAFQTKYAGRGSGCCTAGNAFVVKLNAAGSALVYSTYVGGTNNDFVSAMAVDAWGNAYITGSTQSFNFPTTKGAFQTSLRSGFGNAFVSKLGPAGSALLYSTFLGGSGAGDGASGMAVDASGNAYVTGSTYSYDFPTTPGAFQTTCPACAGYSSGFVTKFNAAGSALDYSTYLGGSSNGFPYGIAVDASGNAYVTGWTVSRNFPTTPGAFQTTFTGDVDAFTSKLNAVGSRLLYSTYFGGSVPSEAGYEAGSEGRGIAVDASGHAYIAGSTNCTDFPTTSGAFQMSFPGSFGDAFVSKLNAAGSELVYSTYLGGSGGSGGSGIAVDASGNANVTGGTSGGFPTTPGAFQTTFGGGFDMGNAFVTKLNAAGSALLYSTYLGGSGGDGGAGIAVDALGNIYVTGVTGSSNFPVTSGAFQIALRGPVDAFVAKISIADVPSVVWTPPNLTFGPQVVGTTSAAQNVLLSNFGTGPLSITSIVPSGDFAQSNDCAGTVPPLGSCTIGVTFTPTATGIRTGAIIITDNAPGSPHQLPLAGAGGIPAVTLTPPSLTFGPQASGTISGAQALTLKNTGDGPLNITGVSASPSANFAETNNCTGTVNPGVSCTLNVTFTPTSQGMLSGDITLTDDAPGSPQTIPLSGTGIGGTSFSPNFTTLTQGLDGNLYGTASSGGTSGLGTVFKATPAGTVTTIYNFDSTHGAVPYAGLVLGTDGNFYGITSQGPGSFGGFGTVFQVTPGGVLATLHGFQYSDGAFPKAALVQGTDGKFYGTTTYGGNYGLGTIFRISSQGLLSTVHNFGYLPQPLAALVEGTDGNFYGSTANGGRYKCCGVVFEISPDSLLNSLHEFGRTDGAHPEAALVKGNDGKFYGTTAAGGANGYGTVFRIGAFGVGGFATVHSFAYSEGYEPASGLIQASDGNFYGTTLQEGASGCGTLFRITPGGTLTILYNFDCYSDGPSYGRPVQHTNGKLYATNGAGQIFSLDVGLGPFVKTLPTSAVLGARVTILGTNLTGATNVSFAGTAATFTVVSSSQITTAVPAGATTGKVRVVTPSGTLFSDVKFGVAPAISGFSPTRGPVGTSVVIMGQNFTGATRVAFGNFNATTFTVDSSTQITATVPLGAKTGKITVTTAGGTATSSATFTVTP